MIDLRRSLKGYIAASGPLLHRNHCTRDFSPTCMVSKVMVMVTSDNLILFWMLSPCLFVSLSYCLVGFEISSYLVGNLTVYNI